MPAVQPANSALVPPRVQRARALLSVAEARTTNAWLRLGGCIFVAVAATPITGGPGPMIWCVGLLVVLLIEHRIHLRIAARCAAGDPPRRLAGLLAWTALQSTYLNALSLLLWFAPYPHGQTLAVIFLVAGLVNAAATLRAFTPLALAGLVPTILCLLGLPLAEFVLGGARQPLDLMPLLGAALFLAFGANLWTSMRTADAAQIQAEAAQMRERQTANAAAQAEAITIARLHGALRTPMAALAGAVEQFRRTASATETRARIGAVTQAMDAVNAALTDVSDPNWLDTDGVAIEPQTIDPREFLRAVVGAFRPAAHDKGLELFLDLPPDAPAQICVDPARLRLALTNLISNAIRFTTTGGVRVRFQVQPAQRPGWVRLAFIVADTGAGMSRSHLALLFARRGAARESESHIGLAITQRLARNLGAKLSAKSELGAGSVFTLTLEAPVSAGRAGLRQASGGVTAA